MWQDKSAFSGKIENFLAKSGQKLQNQHFTERQRDYGRVLRHIQNNNNLMKQNGGHEDGMF